MDSTPTEKQPSNEGPKQYRGLRSSNDIETFYRFIYDNGLRREARMIMELIWAKVSPPKKKKKRASRKKEKRVLQ